MSYRTVEVVHAIGYGDDPRDRDVIVCDTISTAILWIKRYQDAGWDTVYALTSRVEIDGPAPEVSDDYAEIALDEASHSSDAYQYPRADADTPDSPLVKLLREKLAAAKPPPGYTADELERDNPLQPMDGGIDHARL